MWFYVFLILLLVLFIIGVSFFIYIENIKKELQKRANYSELNTFRQELKESINSEEVQNILKKYELEGMSKRAILSSLAPVTREDCLKRFEPVLQGTDCLFARTAKIWGSHWTDGKSLEENVIDNLPQFQDFLILAKALHIDGFVFEVRGKEYHSSIEKFGETVGKVLWTFSENDPAQVKCVSKSYVDKKGWWFEWNKEPIFLTTFAPCYPVNHSRYCFEADSNSSWILFQPEFSFAWHNIGPDTAETNWENPDTMRDKIRCEFKKHDRLYEIPNTIYYPPALHIVKPLKIGMDYIAWWKSKPQTIYQCPALFKSFQFKQEETNQNKRKTE